jgi:hypothetical protein
MKRKRNKTIEWIVVCSAGLAANPRFNNEADALARCAYERSIPSYCGPWLRSASVVKVTTITEVIT